MYKFAKNKIKYVLTGSNFSLSVAENQRNGVVSGIDTTLVKDIYKKFGNNKLKTFPLVIFSHTRFIISIFWE